MTSGRSAQCHRGHAYLPYGRQCVEDDDIQAVVDVLRSDMLTTGPAVSEFESAFADAVGTSEAVAVSSGTAALHAVMSGLGVGSGDEVLVPALTFVASANAIAYRGAQPVFVDVDPLSLLVDPGDVERKITDRTRGIVAVDYAGQPCDYDRLRELADHHGLFLVADSCHSLGASLADRPVGSLADVSVFSLHPVKAITAGEGGVITTDDRALAEQLRRFRNHGIDHDQRSRADAQTWRYSVVEEGYNYRLSDIQCALARSQLRKLQKWVTRRQAIAEIYDEGFRNLPSVVPLSIRPERTHAYHLYVVRCRASATGENRRDRLFDLMRAAAIGVNVHYVPVYDHPVYREQRYQKGLCPATESAYEEILSLPIFPLMTDGDVSRVIETVHHCMELIGGGQGASDGARPGID